MKFAATIACGLAIAVSSQVNAQESVVPSPAAPMPVVPMTTNAPVVVSPQVMVTPMRSMTTRTVSPRVRRNSSSNQSVFGRMMELERRKNAWLRRTFLGR